MVLDGVLADRTVAWLGSEREKRRHFKERLGARLRDDEYPRMVFGKKLNVTVRYFPAAHELLAKPLGLSQTEE